jgi:hypothetical protein
MLGGVRDGLWGLALIFLGFVCALVGLSLNIAILLVGVGLIAYGGLRLARGFRSA